MIICSIDHISTHAMCGMCHSVSTDYFQSCFVQYMSFCFHCPICLILLCVVYVILFPLSHISNPALCGICHSISIVPYIYLILLCAVYAILLPLSHIYLILLCVIYIILFPLSHISNPDLCGMCHSVSIVPYI